MLNRTAIYALKAVGYLALQNEGIFISSHHISREMQIPKDFLSKILNSLCLAGLIQSIRGKGGGFALATHASVIRIGDVVGLFKRVDDPRQCLQAMQGDMTVRSFLRAAAKALLNELERRDSLTSSLARHDWFNKDCSAEYDRLYRLERDAWNLIDRA